MTIPVEVAWEVALVVGGFILGTLWSHHAALGKRVTYEDCSQKRTKCPCIKDIEELKNEMKESCSND